MTRSITLCAKKDGLPLDHFWSKCVGAGRAHEGLRANWLEHLKLAAQECGFTYLRFHGLLHDDMFVYRQVNGAEVYNWQYIDELFDRMLDIGIRPFVELGFCPKDMASGSGTQFWWKGNVTPPKDAGKWARLIRTMVTHWVNRYGLEQVRTWYFEVWNEPNLSDFWRGTRSQYFDLYKSTVTAIKSVDPQLRVGGPATSSFVPDDRFDGELEDKSKHLTFRSARIDDADWRPVWVQAFLDYCSKEQLPVDFVSTHPYPMDFALDETGKTRGHSRNVGATKQDLAVLKRVVESSPFPHAEIHLTEWSSSPSSRDHSHDYVPAAAYVVKANLDSVGLADSLSYWTFTDVFEEAGAGDSIFHGGFGLINFQGIPKPTFHAYRFLHLLGDEEICRMDGGIVTRNSGDGRITALLYNYDEQAVPMTVPIASHRDAAEDVQRKGASCSYHVELCDLEPDAPFLVETLDHEHGFALRAWKEMGMPEPPSREQVNELRSIAWQTKKMYVRADDRGTLSLDLILSPWSIVSVRQQ